AARPVLGVIIARQLLNQIPGYLRRLEQVMQSEPNTLHLAWLPAAQTGRIPGMDHRHGAIQFGANLEYASDMETFQPRKDPGRGDRSFRQDEGQFVARHHTEAAGNQLTD